GPWWRRYLHCSRRRTPRRWTCPVESCSLWRTHAGAGSWQELQPMERSPFRSRFTGRTREPLGTHVGSFYWKWIPRGRASRPFQGL
ncbi:unnamed protein product, partial [Bubo scandiacus]